MDITRQELTERYESLETDDLIDIYRTSDLTDLEKSTLLGVLGTRGVSSDADTKLPDGFILQTMEPTGGKIAKPNDWYFVEQHKNTNSLGWILAKENPDQGPYETGLRIQFLIGIKDGTGKTPKEFVLSIDDERKAKAKKVLKTCPESQQDG